MVAKLKLQLKPNEVVALSRLLAEELGRHDVKELRKEPADMLILSAVYELYEKTKPKAENIRIFGAKRTDELYSVTITRTQALAIICALPNEPQPANAVQTYEGNFLIYLIGKIHQVFLI